MSTIRVRLRLGGAPSRAHVGDNKVSGSVVVNTQACGCVVFHVCARVLVLYAGGGKGTVTIFIIVFLPRNLPVWPQQISTGRSG
jgi:hypothetical protein